MNIAQKAPNSPGVYSFRDKNNEIIYIGKAKNLKKRVASYFRPQKNLDTKTKILVEHIKNAEFTITDNELEALILENLLIKKHKPKYNIKLRDDKNYQFLKIDYLKEIPQIYSVRNKDKRHSSKAKYFGPYTSSLSVKKTLALIKKIFPYCTAKKVENQSNPNKRPCFNYQLHRCPGVCLGIISPEEYKLTFQKIEDFLKGRTKKIEKVLIKQMKDASENKKYEKAAVYRDQLNALEHMRENQKVIGRSGKFADYISFYQKGSLAAINLFKVRDGRLLNRENMILENIKEESPKEALESFLYRYYLDATDIGKEIYLPMPVINKNLFLKFIRQKYQEANSKSYQIQVSIPQKGTNKKIVDLGKTNAQNYLERQSIKEKQEKIQIKNSLLGLKDIIGLKDIPWRIEAFDISNISGQAATGSMIVFEKGIPDKGSYRHFKIKSKNTPDDYAMLAEILNRRLNNKWSLPDLWIIDGGKGQLNIALNVLKNRRKDIKVVAVAKGASRQKGYQTAKDLEKIFIPNKTAKTLKSDDPVLYLIQRIRDEAHRFAITYHRKLKEKDLFKNED